MRDVERPSPHRGPGVGAVLLVPVLVMGLLGGCATSAAQVPSAQTLGVRVLDTFPHDRTMFTQGLQIANGMLYESSGLSGQSRVRINEFSGTTPGPVLAEASLPAPLFGEGIAVTPTRLWQLTWTDEIAIERDPRTLSERRRVPYQGEGWGLCYEAGRLVMSDGSDQLTFRDPESFEPIGRVSVRLDGTPLTGMNELECVNDVVWANVWQTDRIVRIDPESGTVTGVVDAADLLDPAERAEADVLNGIAAIPDSDEFLITGKLWPTMFRVRFVAQ